MPTYNFKSNGEIESDGRLYRTIEGPAVLVPNSGPQTFYVRYLDGSDFYYYGSNNVFKIDGELFEGTLDEFVEAANALYETSGGGGGGYTDVTANTTVAVSNEVGFAFQDGDGENLLKFGNDGEKNYMQLGEDAASNLAASYVNVLSNDAGTSANIEITAALDDYSTGAGVVVQAGGATSVQIDVYGAGGTSQIKAAEAGIQLTGIVEYADNAAAITGGLQAGFLYRTGDVLKIVHA